MGSREAASWGTNPPTLRTKHIISPVVRNMVRNGPGNVKQWDKDAFTFDFGHVGIDFLPSYALLTHICNPKRIPNECHLACTYILWPIWKQTLQIFASISLKRVKLCIDMTYSGEERDMMLNLQEKGRKTVLLGSHYTQPPASFFIAAVRVVVPGEAGEVFSQ